MRLSSFITASLCGFLPRREGCYYYEASEIQLFVFLSLRPADEFDVLLLVTGRVESCFFLSFKLFDRILCSQFFLKPLLNYPGIRILDFSALLRVRQVFQSQTPVFTLVYQFVASVTQGYLFPVDSCNAPVEGVQFHVQGPDMSDVMHLDPNFRTTVRTRRVQQIDSSDFPFRRQDRI